MARRLQVLTLLLALGSYLVLGATPAGADPTGTSRGDAQAVLYATPTGGNNIRTHGSTQAVTNGAAAQWDLRITLVSDGQHYCVEDWHTIQSAWLLAVSDADGTNQSTFQELETLGFAFYVDGTEVLTERLPIQPVHLNDPLLEGRWFAQTTGTLVAPGTYSVGEHTLVTTVIHPEFGNETITTTFVMDASGTGACVTD